MVHSPKLGPIDEQAVDIDSDVEDYRSQLTYKRAAAFSESASTSKRAPEGEDGDDEEEDDGSMWESLG
jgi:hypothetical protein